LECFKNTFVDRFILQDIAIFIDKNADRHTPCTLTRQYPIRTAFNHRPKTCLACRRYKTCIVNRLERTRTECGVVTKVLVHIDEPLRRVAEDDRLFRAPGMRVGMLQPATCE